MVRTVTAQLARRPSSDSAVAGIGPPRRTIVGHVHLQARSDVAPGVPSVSQAASLPPCRLHRTCSDDSPKGLRIVWSSTPLQCPMVTLAPPGVRIVAEVYRGLAFAPP